MNSKNRKISYAFLSLWILGTGLGGAVAGAVGDWLIGPGGPVRSKMGLAGTSLTGAIVVGVLQSIILWRKTPKAFLWCFASFGGGVVGAAVTFATEDWFGSLLLGIAAAAALQAYYLQRVGIQEGWQYWLATIAGLILGLVPSCMMGLGASEARGGGGAETYATGGLVVGIVTGVVLARLLRAKQEELNRRRVGAWPKHSSRDASMKAVLFVVLGLLFGFIGQVIVGYFWGENNLPRNSAFSLPLGLLLFLGGFLISWRLIMRPRQSGG